ncbi:MAG: hypothetical protein ACP5NS_00595 [Candidatus Pacearchaeota archaeon]
MNNRSTLLALIAATAFGSVGGFIASGLREKEIVYVNTDAREPYDDSVLRRELDELRTELRNMDETARRIEFIESKVNHVSNGHDKTKEKEEREVVEYSTPEQVRTEARKLASAYARAAMLHGKTKFNLDAAALLYESFDPAAVDKMTGAFETMAHFADSMGLSPNAQKELAITLYADRTDFFAGQKISTADFKQMAINDPQRFRQVLADYRGREVRAIGDWLTNNPSHVQGQQMGRFVSYFTDPSMGPAHVASGIEREFTTLTGQANGNGPFGFGW